MSKDYYKILGVDKKAGAEEIKKAFRKLAHQHHPDKAGGDEAKFKEINEAYQVVGDTEKRQKYDQYGTDFEQMGGFGGGAGWDDFMRAARGQAGAGGFANGGQSFHFGNVDLGDLFGDFFGFGGGQQSTGGGRGDSANSGGGNQGADLRMQTELTFEEAALGTEKTFEISKLKTCPVCHGSGAAPGSAIKTCQTCGGRGRVRRVQNFLFGQFETEALCPACQGRGQLPEKKCSECQGRGAAKGREELKVKFPAGIDDGETLRLVGQGDAGEMGRSAGNLYITVRVKPHSGWQRHGYDIFSQKDISYSQLVLGAIINVGTLSGDVSLKIPEGTPSGQIFRLRGKGIKNLHSTAYGDHLVEVRVVVPKKLSHAQKDLLKDLSVAGL